MLELSKIKYDVIHQSSNIKKNAAHCSRGYQRGSTRLEPECLQYTANKYPREKSFNTLSENVRAFARHIYCHALL